MDNVSADDLNSVLFGMSVSDFAEKTSSDTHCTVLYLSLY